MSVSLVKTPDFIDYPAADIAEMESELWDSRQWVLDVAERFGEDSSEYARAIEMRDDTRTVLRCMQFGQPIPEELL
ncbi:hypothetical protein CH298_03565 [Rhodococcoides fascians]|uniref:hypothetical protein n=1 Tax=Rhodococcoides fascians TaxID=1828 RepID=UPI000B9A6719|nr:hypothetical protein [Rhodococcus fascians]OZE92601.1 hypothetical protein CH303_03565 [Rhodococcus fascians]OZF23234.1 hypothetical protein CH298_03565 [Rhodococcus fascians]OZF24948.1 hypothetical protein CH297_03565 [Rhodococcus fascians]OZF72543.1 hypothetical protein CH308_03570 [Rhodococcus fascians]OZF73841.1 hypothetical protein CH307_03570 [Rhodococcus fascians]